MEGSGGGGRWDSVPLSPPPPAYSLVVVESEQRERGEERRESSSSSVYGEQDDCHGAGGRDDRMSILSFIGHYEYYRPEKR